MKASFYQGQITGPSGQRHSFRHPEEDFEGMSIDEVRASLWETESMIFFDLYPNVNEEDAELTFNLVES